MLLPHEHGRVWGALPLHLSILIPPLPQALDIHTLANVIRCRTRICFNIFFCFLSLALDAIFISPSYDNVHAGKIRTSRLTSTWPATTIQRSLMVWFTPCEYP